VTLLQEFHGDREYQRFVKCKNPLGHEDVVNVGGVELRTFLWVNSIFLKCLGDDYGSCVNALPVSGVTALY
jgi:hypothetical protein